MKWSRFLIIAILLSITASLIAQDWPQWRGPNRDNISTETEWNPAKLDAPNPISWKVNVGKGHSSVIVIGDRLYTQGMTEKFTGSDTTYKEQLIALDAVTGKTIWKHENTITNRRLTFNFAGPGATPSWDNGKIYYQGREGLFHCLNADDGTVIWQKHLVNEELGKLPSWGFNASPAIDKDILFLNVGEAGVALNKNNGNIIWKSAVESGGDATPLLFHRNGQQFLMLNTDSKLCVLDPKTGEMISSTLGGSNTDPVFVDKDIIFTKAGSKRLIWNGTSFEQQWSNPQIKGSFMTGILLNDTYYTMDSNRGRNFNLACLDAKTGEIKWQEKLGENGSLMATKDWLVILTGLGELILAKPNAEKFEPIYHAKVLTLPSREGIDNMRWANIWSYPVLSHGRIYCKDTYGNLACINMN
ncbi:PQQ-binding-like beta-propeller repeat protein [bacterium]|nr:PQQ-binding-like beta-propeller repeat protein [bacterium]